MVSRRDLIAILARSDARIHDDVTTTLAHNGQPDRWAVTVQDGIVGLRGTADEPARRLADVLTRSVPGVTRVAILDPADHT